MWFWTLVLVAVSAHVEGRGFDPWVCAFCSLEVVACVAVMSCVTVWVVCVTVCNLREGECSGPGSI